MGLWEPRKLDVTDEVTEALARAAAEATRRRHRYVAETHLVWALFACPSVTKPLAAMGLDGEALRGAMSPELATLPSSSWLSFRAPVVTYVDGLRRALTNAASTGRTEVEATLLLAYLTKGREPPGFSNLAFRQVVAHGDLAPPPPPADGQVSIVMLDDPFTTMVHVVETLRDVFGVTADAEQLMMTVHRSGRAVVATLEADIARRKIDEAHARAAAAGLPLRILGEPADQPHR